MEVPTRLCLHLYIIDPACLMELDDENTPGNRWKILIPEFANFVVEA